MPAYEYSSTLPFPADEVYDWHTRPGAFERLLPPWDDVRVVKVEGEFERRHVHLELRQGPIVITWVARHQDVQPGRQFVDVQEQGPFSRWTHTHSFTPMGSDCRLDDHVDFQVGHHLGSLGDGAVQHRLARMFEFRHTRIRHDLTRHRAWASRGPQVVAVTGATGTIGRSLVAFLRSGGHTVLRITRQRTDDRHDIFWDPQQGILDGSQLEGVDAVVNLAGHNLSDKAWTPEEKTRILESRVKGTTLLSETLARLQHKPRVFISGSAVGYYGDRGESPVDETAPAGMGFLPDVCRAWEKATEAAQKAEIRTVHMRTGVVLTSLLARLYTPFSLGLGATLGDGHQMLSWISLDDLVGAIYHTMYTESLSGPVNATAPAPVPAKTFTKTLARVMHRPALLSVPKPVVKGIFGEMGEAVLLEGANVQPSRLMKNGFPFFYPALEAALANELPMSQTKGRSGEHTEQMA